MASPQASFRSRATAYGRDASFGMDVGDLPNSFRRSSSVALRNILYPRTWNNSFWPSALAVRNRGTKMLLITIIAMYEATGTQEISWASSRAAKNVAPTHPSDTRIAVMGFLCLPNSDMVIRPPKPWKNRKLQTTRNRELPSWPVRKTVVRPKIKVASIPRNGIQAFHLKYLPSSRGFIRADMVPTSTFMRGSDGPKATVVSHRLPESV